jgi:MFS family permease
MDNRNEIREFLATRRAKLTPEQTSLPAFGGKRLAFASTNENLGLFIAAGVLGGIGMGVATSSSMNTLLPEALPKERAGLLAVIYAISYTGSAAPSLIAGQASKVLNLSSITTGYAVLAVLVWIATLLTARNQAENLRN